MNETPKIEGRIQGIYVCVDRIYYTDYKRGTGWTAYVTAFASWGEESDDCTHATSLQTAILHAMEGAVAKVKRRERNPDA